MSQEIERKFLVIGDDWRVAAGSAKVCRQGYITSGPVGATVRVRLMEDQAFLTVKGPAKGFSRFECEYGIPVADAEYMIENLCGDHLVFKKRYMLKAGGVTWEIDEFSGLNEGLIVAEVELKNENQSFCRPDWLGKEVTFDPHYTNAMLARHPFSRW